jgi:V8-like Glu-specific endopeptidase
MNNDKAAKPTRDADGRVSVAAEQVEVEPGDKSMTIEGHRPADEVWCELRSSPARAADFVDFTGEYILTQEPDGRYRLVGTSFERKVTSKEVEAQYVPQKYFRERNTTTLPYRCCGHLISTFPNKKTYIGSGTMIGRHHCLTAGHTIFSTEDGGWADTVQFNAGQDEESKPYGAAFGLKLRGFWDYTHRTNPNDRNWDMGMVLLDRELGDRTTWLVVATSNDTDLSRQPITVAGYPGIKGGQQLWLSVGSVLSIFEDTIVYDVYASGGDSGGAVYGANNQIYAVHVAGGNMGCRVTSSKLSSIKEWLKL